MGIQIPTETITKVEQFLFSNGCLVISDEKNYKKSLVKEIPNLTVRRIMMTLVTLNYATKIHSGAHHFYTLTEEGVNGLKKKYSLAEDIMPNTYRGVSRS